MARPVLTGLLAGLLAAPASARDVVQCCRCKSKGLCKFGLSDCEEGKAIEVHTAFLEGEKDTDCKLKILGTERKNWFHEDNPNEPDKKLSILLSDRHPDDALRAVLGGGDSRQLIVTVGNFPKLKERVTTRGKTEIGKLQKQLDKEKKEKEDAEEEKRKENEAFNNEKKNQEEEERKRKEKEDFKEEDAPFCEELKDELESVKGDIEKEKVKAQELKKELASRKAFLEKAIKKMQVFVKPTNTTGQVKTEAAARSRRTGTRWHKPVGRFIKNFLKK
mmetsp:Transcript_14974/g.42842  ORF Transcript_14974/g.42842 Transcript_14974/m.42842 type:complete len:276 (+) Transcript_14974:60-887(+)